MKTLVREYLNILITSKIASGNDVAPLSLTLVVYVGMFVAWRSGTIVFGAFLAFGLAEA